MEEVILARNLLIMAQLMMTKKYNVMLDLVAAHPSRDRDLLKQTLDLLKDQIVI